MVHERMTESGWMVFFSLMEIVVKMPETTWRGKRRAVQGAAMELGFESCLEEFVGWFDGEGDESE